jgi:hypothetical protein
MTTPASAGDIERHRRLLEKVSLQLDELLAHHRKAEARAKRERLQTPQPAPTPDDGADHQNPNQRRRWIRR